MLGKSERQMADGDFTELSVIRNRDDPRLREERKRERERIREAGAWAPQGLLLAIYGPARSRTRMTRGVRERTVRNPAI